ncbi:MAG: efflux RND transporter periplasmic adaptor subunit, partial [Flavobacterium sp.]
MRTLLLTILSLMIFACSGEKSNTEDIIKTNDLDKIKKHREVVHADYEKLMGELTKLDAAIGELDTLQKFPLVKTLKLKDTTFTHYIEINGNVDTKENIIITPEYSGVLSQVNVKAGQKVSKGQVLARVDDGGMSSNLAQAETQLALLKTTFERQKNLWEQKIGSEIQYLQAKTSWESQQKVVAQLKSQLSKTLVIAPFTGTIDEVITEKGQVVNPQSQLFRIVSLKDMYVHAQVPENYLGKLKIGAIVEVKIPALGKSLNGKVRQIGSYINPNNRSFSIEIALPNQDELLRPNQVAVLKIEDYTNLNAILVPEFVLGEAADAS